MAAQTISHIIGIVALVALIFVLPLFYSLIVNNVTMEMKERELKEVADYVSNSLWNLHILANSTSSDILVTKKLDLPSTIRDSSYYVEIQYGQNGFAQHVAAYMKNDIQLRSTSLIFPGFIADNSTGYFIESGEQIFIAGCTLNSTGSYVWIKEEELPAS